MSKFHSPNYHLQSFAAYFKAVHHIIIFFVDQRHDHARSFLFILSRAFALSRANYNLSQYNETLNTPSFPCKLLLSVIQSLSRLLPKLWTTFQTKYCIEVPHFVKHQCVHLLILFLVAESFLLPCYCVRKWHLVNKNARLLFRFTLTAAAGEMDWLFILKFYPPLVC